jgi:hypothetical protein
MHEAVAAIADAGSSPVVRIADNQGWMVKSKFISLSKNYTLLINVQERLTPVPMAYWSHFSITRPMLLK